jgi:SPOR domain
MALLVAACSRGDRANAAGAASVLPSSGPDPVVVRIPLGGGTVRAYRYPALDSVLWSSAQPAPAIDRVLAFDAENGVLAILDRAGRPGWLDLRLGTVRTATRDKLSVISSVDGWAIFGVTAANVLVRLTPSDEWTLPAGHKVRRLFPLPDGTLLALGDEGERSVLLRVRPPDVTLGDSVVLDRPGRGVATSVGDRVYFASARHLVGVHPQDLARLDRLEAPDEILALAPTPSGDRVFVANKGSSRLDVVDRYAAEFQSSVQLPGLVTELRMDPMGRYVLARPVSGDSAWLVAIATETLRGTVQTSWRLDLPAFAADGRIARIDGDDVVFEDAASHKAVQRVEGGARDVWYFTTWNGFRPRAKELDEPVTFALGTPPPGDTHDVDTASVPATADTAVAAASAPPVAAPRPAPPVTPPPAQRTLWTVSFAAVLSQDRAREIAGTIAVDGQHPRVVSGLTAGTTVYRVIFGPYATKGEADRVGRSSQHNYWVYEGIP